MITVVTTHGRFTIADAEHWARDESGDVHLYDEEHPAPYASDDDNTSFATVEAARFVAVFRTDEAVNPTSELPNGDGFDRNPNTPDR